MNKNEILLSSGCVLWYKLEKAVQFAKEVGCDGIELLPTRKFSKEFRTNIIHVKKDFKLIKGIHQNWRLDSNRDRDYGIPFSISIFFTFIRFIFFSSKKNTHETISELLTHVNVPLTIHSLSQDWTKDNRNKEFDTNIFYELMGEKHVNKDEIEHWLQSKKHFMVIDTRDDQSLSWARENGFHSWMDYWRWIGLKKIGNLQLSLIGKSTMKRILNHEHTLAEEQLLWLHKNNWQGSVTIEINPLTIGLLMKGDIKSGIKVIVDFVKHTLQEGKSWS